MTFIVPFGLALSVTIPTWVLWVIGVAAGIAALILMVLGVLFICAFWDFRVF